MTDEIELYSIDSFYVGILNISCKMGNLLIPHNTNFSDLSKRKFELLNNGALYKEYFNNWNRRLAYDSIYTLFLKKDNKYLCLHNGKIYTENGDDYCCYLQKFKDTFPKIDFNLSDKITIPMALNYFDIIYSKVAGVSLHDSNITHPLDFYYIGDLNLATHTHDINTDDKIDEQNILNEIKLKREMLIAIYSKLDYNNQKENTFDIFQCIFLKQGAAYYNISDFSYYKTSGNSYCDQLIPAVTYFENKNSCISIPDNISINYIYELYEQQRIIDEKNSIPDSNNSKKSPILKRLFKKKRY